MPYIPVQYFNLQSFFTLATQINYYILPKKIYAYIDAKV